MNKISIKLPMNTFIRLRRIAPFTFLSFLISGAAFGQSITLLPKSQNNTDSLTTRHFRMTEGADMFKIMMSDNLGNGIWISPNLLTDTYWAVNNAAHLYQVPAVNLGVGTDTPAYKLDVRQNNANILASFSGNNSNGTGIRISSKVSGSLDNSPISSEWQLFHSGTGITSENGGYGQLHFKDQTGTKMILRNNGRLGIGVLNPSEMLEVNGNARINGRIDIQNTGLGVFIGEGAGKNDDLTQKYNTFIGFNAGNSVKSGSNNLAIGAGALESNVTGGFNVAVGRLALVGNTSGGSNVAIGSYAGSNATGSYNIFIGDAAGSNATGNDKLYIHNSNSATPLIFGDFFERNLGVNGRLIIGAHTPLENASKLDVLATDNARFIVQSWTPANNALVVARLLSSTSVAPQLRFERAGNNFIDIGQDSNGSFVIEDNTDVSRMVVTSAGKVGIGTDDPDSQLEIFTTNNEIFRATSTSKIGTWFKLENTSVGGKSWKLISTGSENGEGAGNLAFKDETSTRMLIKSTNGAVGIGTETPASQLEVSTTTNETIRATSSSTTGTWLAINNTSLNGKNWKFISTGSSNSEGSGHLLVKNDSGSKMIIKNNGAVGIGTETPTQAKLVINGSQTANLSYGYLNNKASTGTASGTNYYSIYTSDRIATSELNVYSDARIKKIKGLSDNFQDLDIIKNIRITDYQLIDSVSKGNTLYKKVIAQQVETVYPSAVTRMTDFIPDIYQLSSIEKGFIPLPNTTLKAGDKLKLIDNEKQEITEVLSVSHNGIQVNSEKSGKVFVYGREVNDFRTVDYEALTTLNISATQALLKRIETLEKENQEIKQLAKEIENLKNMVLVSQKGK
jgi:hypothetical protein